MELGITWWDCRESEVEEWTAWPSTGRGNEWWLLLVLVTVIELACLIPPPLQCLHGPSVSPGTCSALPLFARLAEWETADPTRPCTHWVPGLPGVLSSSLAHLSHWQTYQLQGWLLVPAVLVALVTVMVAVIDWKCKACRIRTNLGVFFFFFKLSSTVVFIFSLPTLRTSLFKVKK